MTFSSFFGRKCRKTQEIHEEINENDAPLPRPRYFCGRACKGATRSCRQHPRRSYPDTPVKNNKNRRFVISFHLISFFYFTSSHFISFHCVLFIHSFIHSSIHSFIPSFLLSFLPSFIHSFIPSFLHSFIPSFLHSSIRSFVRSFIPSFIHPFIPSFIHAFIHSFNHTFHGCACQDSLSAGLRSSVKAFPQRHFGPPDVFMFF